MTSADYRVVVIQSTGKKEAILDIARLEYGDIINQIRTFSLTIGKSNEDDYSKFNAYEVVSGTETGVIYIYRQGTLDFAGIIENPTYDKFGRLVLTGIGMEVKIGWKGTGTDKTYSDSALSAIITSMIGEISGIDVSAANNEDSADGDLTKVDVSGMSYLDGLKHAIVDLGDNEWYMTYSDSGNSDFNNVQYRGSNTSIGKLVEGIDISRVQRTKNTQRIFNKVIALGKSEGETKITITREANQVTGHSGYDMAKYGTREPSKPLVNRRIQNVTDLTKFADNFLTQHMYPVEIITFDVDDIDFSHNVGDLVTIRAKARLKDTGDVNTADMRIISQKRIITPESERLILGVTKEGLNTLPTDISTRMNRIEDQMLSQQTTPQGQKSVLPIQNAEIADSTNPIRILFYVTPELVEDAGDNKVLKVTMAYSFKKYKKITGYQEDVAVTAVGKTRTNTVTETADTKSSTVTNTGDSSQNRYTEVTGTTGTVAKEYIKAHSHDLEESETTSKELPTPVSDYPDQDDMYIYTYFTNGARIPITTTGNKQMLLVHFGIKNDLGSQKYFYARLYYKNYAQSWEYAPDSGGQKIWIPNGGWGYWFFLVPTYPATHYIWMKGESSGTIRTMTSAMGIPPHTHTIPSDANGAENESFILQKTNSTNFPTTQTGISQSQQTTVYATSDTKLDRVDDTSDTKSLRVEDVSDTSANRVTATIVDLTEINTTATGIILKIDDTDRTVAVFGSSPHNQTQDEEIDITDYVSSVGWHTIEIYPQGDKAYTLLNVNIIHYLKS